MQQTLKNGMVALAETRMYGSMLDCMERIREPATKLLRVVTYHRVDHENEYPDLDPRLLSCTPNRFAQQLDYFAANYQVISLDDVFAAIRGDVPLPARALLITFDDAYEGFQKNAWPLLCSRKLPATMFVPTAYPDNPQFSFWWDRLHVALRNTGQSTLGISRRVKQMPHDEAMEFVDDFCKDSHERLSHNHVLSWNQLRQLKDEGLDLAPHTETHPLITKLPLKRAIEEATRSRDELERQIGKCIDCLAYPAGDIDLQTAEAIGDSGFQIGFTTQRGINNFPVSNPTLLRRINVGRRTTLNVLRTQLHSWNRFWCNS